MRCIVDFTMRIELLVAALKSRSGIVISALIDSRGVFTSCTGKTDK